MTKSRAPGQHSGSVAATDRADRKRALIEHQSERLRATYADWARQERYRLVTDFFFNGIYTTRDKSQRDAQFKSLYTYFQGKMGLDVIRALGGLVDLNELTDRLDERVLDALLPHCSGGRFTNRQYEQAYRDAEHHEDRVRQIQLIVDSVTYFHQLAHWRTIGLMLKVVRLTARLKGADELGQFIEDGFQAFRSLDDARGFVQVIKDREHERLERIWREYHPSVK